MAAVPTSSSFVGSPSTTSRLEAIQPTSTSFVSSPATYTNRRTHDRLTLAQFMVSPLTFFRSAYPNPMGSIGVPSAGGSGVVTYFKKRARDSGAPGVTYVTWVTTLSTQPYPFTPPFGGPLVEVIIAELWQV